MKPAPTKLNLVLFPPQFDALHPPASLNRGHGAAPGALHQRGLVVGIHRPLGQRSLDSRMGRRSRSPVQSSGSAGIAPGAFPGPRPHRPVRVAASECTARAPTLKTTSRELPSGGVSTFLSSARMWAITCSINEYSCNFCRHLPLVPQVSPETSGWYHSPGQPYHNYRREAKYFGLPEPGDLIPDCRQRVAQAFQPVQAQV